MPDLIEPYIEKHPHDLISARDWNQIQVMVKKDIAEQIVKAIAAIAAVPRSDDSGKLGGKTPEELSKAIVESLIQEMNRRTGYMRAFRYLTHLEPVTVKHGLKDNPLVDLYELASFEAVCSEDDERTKHHVFFYLQHTSERTISFRPSSTEPVEQVPIDPPKGPAFRLSFPKLLELYKVEYDNDTSLGDVEAEFWTAFLEGTGFDDPDTCHSPWFDRCCRESKTVGDLKRRGDWDEIWLQTRPIKIANVLSTPPMMTLPTSAAENLISGLVEVRQHDFEQVSLTYRGVPDPSDPDATQPPRFPLMLLLKV